MKAPSEVHVSDVERLCNSIYDETAAEYEKMKSQMGDSALGFKILYGPPIVNAPVLFLGYQPGGRLEDALSGEAIGERRTWPNRCEYAYETWRLAKQIRKIWSPVFLEHCVAINANFFRSPSSEEWRQYRGNRVASAFCLKRAEAITEAVSPQHIVVVGFTTFDHLATGKVVLSGGKDRALIKRGTLWGRPAHGIIHLSAQISNSDMSAMRSYFETQISYRPLLKTCPT